MASIIINDTDGDINYNTNPLVGSGNLNPGTSAIVEPRGFATCSINPSNGSSFIAAPNTLYSLVEYKFEYSSSPALEAETEKK